MDEFKQYEVSPDGIWTISLACGDMGYDAMDRARPEGWRPVPSWGSDFRDLGEWPLVIVFVKADKRGLRVAIRVEGDVTEWQFKHEDIARRNALIDTLQAEWNPPKHNQVYDRELSAWQCPTCDSASDDCVLA